MKTTSVNSRASFDHPVKLTALNYLIEALGKQRCGEALECIKVAREFGAEEFEIDDLLMLSNGFRTAPEFIRSYAQWRRSSHEDQSTTHFFGEETKVPSYESSKMQKVS